MSHYMNSFYFSVHLLMTTYHFVTLCCVMHLLLLITNWHSLPAYSLHIHYASIVSHSEYSRNGPNEAGSNTRERSFAEKYTTLCTMILCIMFIKIALVSHSTCSFLLPHGSMVSCTIFNFALRFSGFFVLSDFGVHQIGEA